jgi:predicted dehydrogenase
MDYVAVVGTGSAGMRHLKVLGAMAGITPIAVPKRMQRLSELAALGYAVARSIEQAAEMDARHCVVASDTGKHASDSIAALHCGMDILVEKPLATEAEAAIPVLEKAAEEGRQVFVASPLRFSKSITGFRHVVPLAGRLHSIRIECHSYLPEWRPSRPYRDSYSARSDEGGVLRDLVHEIDYAVWLFGWPEVVHAYVKNLGRLRIQSDELAELTWETADGAIVSIGIDYLTRPPRREMHACGEAGTVSWDALTGTVILSVADNPRQTSCAPDSADELFSAQDTAFVYSSSKSDPRLATGIDGAKVLAICDAARRSTQSRREEVVEYPLNG